MLALTDNYDSLSDYSRYCARVMEGREGMVPLTQAWLEQHPRLKAIDDAIVEACKPGEEPWEKSSLVSRRLMRVQRLVVLRERVLTAMIRAKSIVDAESKKNEEDKAEALRTSRPQRPINELD